LGERFKHILRKLPIEFLISRKIGDSIHMMAKNKGGCAFSMVVISKLPHAESGPNDHPISDWSVLTDSTFIFFSDRLLDFDRNATRRTEVVDDESDYYKGVDEAKVREQRHGSRLNKKFTLNLESGKISDF